MNGSSVKRSDAASAKPTATSVLGVKGPLRFRPHGSTQKAHVILRRVVIPDDSDGDGDGKGVVCFSLFAQKRIEVKPGKEILLAVASPDGRFKDQPIVFEGDFLGSEDTSDEEDVTQVAEDEEPVYLPPVGEAIPPKMRRAWTKKVEEVSPVLQFPVGHASIGVQAEPVCMSTATQAQPRCISTAIQTQIPHSSISIQVDPPQPPIRTSLGVQVGESRRYVDLDAQTNAPPARRSSLRYEGLPDDDVPFIIDIERSLSPMELDSSSESAPGSPVFSPTGVVDMINNLNLPSHSPTSSIASSSDARHIRETQKPRLHTPLKETKPPSPRPRSGGGNRATARSAPRRVKSPVIKIESPPQHNIPLLSVHTSSQNVDRPSHKQKHEIPNPFVSGGFVTEFAGGIEQKPIPIKLMETETVLPKNITAKQPSIRRDRPPHLDMPLPTTYRVTPAKQPNASAHVSAKSQPIVANAVASSSKVVLDRVTSSIPIDTKPPKALSSRAQAKSPILSLPAIQRITQGTTVPASLGNIPGQAPAKPSSPPPDPKSLAYIPAGPSSNPLNIKPSANASLRRVQRAPPKAPKCLTTPAKKPVVVGSGWPLVRGSNGTGRGSSTTSSTPLPPLQQPPTQTIKTQDLSNILLYSSPSPPPPPPVPTSKWKRVAGEELPALPPVDTSPSINGQHEVEQKGRKARKSVVVVDSPVVEATPKFVSSKESATAPPLPSSPQIPLPTRLENDQRSRVSNTPASLPSNSSALNAKDPPTPAPQILPPITLPSLPQVLTHPLPAKPAPFRGVKRERPTTPDLYTPEFTRRRKRTFRWPTVASNYSVGLKGEGDLAINTISFSSDGSHFALSCADRTIRVWNNRNREEIARLSHNAPVMAVTWLEGDSGVISLGGDGIVSKWTRTGQNHWLWAKVLDAGAESRSDDDQICLAYRGDRIAVAFPRSGVKVWVWLKGTWQSQRSILRQNVTSIKFVDGGAALLGGTRDGVLWYCEVPNGTLRAYAFLKSKITSLDLTPTGGQVLVGQVGGIAITIGIRQPDHKGAVEQSYSCKETQARPTGGFGAVFATQGQAILFGSVEGCALVWDKKKAAIVYGLEHEEDDLIQAVASFDGVPSNGKDGCLITGTKQGHLAWWSQPVAASQDDSHKRLKAV